MVKANRTIFNFYLAMIESFSEYLNQKYPEGSLDNPDHYKTIIIQKIVQMFHTLNTLAKESKDEVSARCVLRGILDSVTTYCFIYQRDDINDMMFRHYLYEIDGVTTYKTAIVDGILEEGINKPIFEYSCNEVIKQLKQQLYSHPYMNLKNRNIEIIIQNNNWKYESIENPRSLSFQKMYKQIMKDTKLVNYYQGILSQYTHGLCLSNTPPIVNEQLQNVIYESIPLADRMIQGICNTFPLREMLEYYRHTDSYKELFFSLGFEHEELLEFTRSIIEKEKILYI